MPKIGLAPFVALITLLVLTGCSSQGSDSEVGNTTRSESRITPAPSSGSTTVAAGTTPPTGSTATGGSSAGELQEIRFPAGGTSTSVQGVTDAGTHERYVFAARAGQTATLSIGSEGNVVGFSLVSPDGEPLITLMSQAREGEVELPTDGDYTVGIGSPSSGIEFILRLSIP